jgi:hypothetical protein
MYRWIVFLHVLSAFGFLLAHGASAAVMFKVRGEQERARLHALLDLSNAVGLWMAYTLLAVLVTGIILGFMGGWWRSGWIWVSLVLLIVLSVVMSYLGRMYLERVRHAIGVPTYDDNKKQVAPPPPASPEVLSRVLAGGQARLLAAIGIGGLVLIVWLMMFKPF